MLFDIKQLNIICVCFKLLDLIFMLFRSLRLVGKTFSLCPKWTLSLLLGSPWTSAQLYFMQLFYIYAVMGVPGLPLTQNFRKITVPPHSA